jgi:hypothetical protein
MYGGHVKYITKYAGKLEGTRSLEKPRPKWEINNKY